MSLGFPAGKSFEFEGKIYGRVDFPPRGTRGFGYDPIFTAKGQKKTFGELSPKYKNQISHRSNAFKKIKKYFNFN